MARMKVLLVDDQGLFLEGLRHLLAAHGLDVVGTAADGLEALTKARALRPEVILMDVRMPRCDGLEATRLIMAEMPEVKVVMLTVSEDDDALFEAIRSGAFGYLLKQSDASEVLRTLSHLSRGEPPLSRGLAARILKEFARQTPPSAETDPARGAGTAVLSARQVGVLTLAAQGMTYREIGATLSLTEHTVKYHMKQILERLHLENRAQVVAYAHRTGLIHGSKGPSADS